MESRKGLRLYHGSLMFWEIEEFLLFILVMDLGQKKLTQVGSGQFFVARVGPAIYGLGLENFP